MYRGWPQTDCQNWLKHVQRMDTDRLPNVATTCTEDGHRETAKSGYNTYREWTEGLPKVATTCAEDGQRQTGKSGYNMYRV